MFGFTSLRSSMQTLIPSRLDWSLKSVIPSTFLSLTSSAIFSINLALFTMYGSSVTTMRFFPFAIGSILETARTRIFPRPVLYASSIPLVPRIDAPVGKSGPLMISMISSMVVSSLSAIWSSMIFTTAPITSLKL